MKAFLVVAILLLGLPAPAGALETTGLPIPRFVSLRADQVNLRAGPGIRYPVKWVYMQRDLPLEVIAEFDNWRKVRDWEGTEGWIHSSMLSGRRAIRVTGVEQRLRAAPNEKSHTIARVESEVVGRLLECPEASEYCRVSIKNMKGWLKRTEFWGAYAGEHVE